MWATGLDRLTHIGECRSQLTMASIIYAFDDCVMGLLGSLREAAIWHLQLTSLRTDRDDVRTILQ